MQSISEWLESLGLDQYAQVFADNDIDLELLSSLSDQDLEKLGAQLSTVNKTYDGVMNKLTTGNGNLIRQASSFVDLGVKVKKTLPKSLSEQAGVDES